MFYLDLVEYEKTDSYSEDENILRNPVAGAVGGVVERSSNQGNVKLARNHLILFVENDWVVLGGEEETGQQDLRSQSESASETAYSQEEDTSQIPVLPALTRSVSKVQNTIKLHKEGFKVSFSEHLFWISGQSDRVLEYYEYILSLVQLQSVSESEPFTFPLMKKYKIFYLFSARSLLMVKPCKKRCFEL